MIRGVLEGDLRGERGKNRVCVVIFIVIRELFCNFAIVGSYAVAE